MWVTETPYPGYVQSTMEFSGQPAEENVYQSWLDFLFDVRCGMTVMELVRLQASERNRRSVRNTVEVH